MDEEVADIAPDFRKRFAMFYELDERILDDLDSRLIAQTDSVSKTARWLQETLGLFPKLTHKNLHNNLCRYRDNDLAQKALTRVKEMTHGLLSRHLIDRVDVLIELESLTTAQRLRVVSALSKESGGGIPLKFVTDQIQVFQKLLTDFANLQLELGVIQRAPKSVTGSVVDEAGKVSLFSWLEEYDTTQAMIHRHVKNSA